MKKSTTIKCPNCEQEYTISEIFFDEDLIGTQVNVQKDENGKIFCFEGEEPTLEQTYICDKCGKEFKVKASLTFSSELVEQFDLT